MDAANLVFPSFSWLYYDGGKPDTQNKKLAAECCQNCGERLVIIATISRTHLLLVCDNTRCNLFSQPQKTIPKPDAPPKPYTDKIMVPWLLTKRGMQ